MIAAVSPTSASSRSGTPAPRSDRACKPLIRLARSLAWRDTTRPYGTFLRPQYLCCRLGDQTSGVSSEHFRNPLDAHRPGAQNARGDPGQVNDRRGSALLTAAPVEIDVDEIAELAAGFVGVRRGRATGDAGTRHRHRTDCTQQLDGNRV